ncbi:MAG: S-layer homology domain-containing protein [Bacillota bacterium]|nr:S-layer homology domain-containing protein [Bacillota bacterium]
MLKNKKILVLLLCLVMLAQASGVMAVSFTDLSKTENTAWANDYILDLANKGIINGYPDGTYRPNGNVTTLETISLLHGIMAPDPSDVNAALAKHKAYINTTLPDISWGEERVAYALERGVVTKTDLEKAHKNGMLKDGTKVYASRITVSMMMARALGLKEKTIYTLTYKDYKAIPENFRPLIAALIDTGVLHKDGVDGYFLPEQNVTRAQIAKMVKVSYDWKAKNDLMEERKTESGQVFEVLTINKATKLVYSTKNSTTNTSVEVDKNTKITDKNGKAVAIKDLEKFKGADLTVVYTGKLPDKLAKEIKFTSDGSFVDGIFTFVSFRKANNKNYLTIKDSKGREMEVQSVYDYAKEGNNERNFAFMSRGTELEIKFTLNLVKEATIAKEKSGEYTFKYVDNRKEIITLAKTNKYGRIEEEDFSYDPLRVIVEDQNGNRLNLTNSLINYSVDVRLDGFFNRVEKIVFYLNKDAQYTVDRFSATDLIVKDSYDKIHQFKTASRFNFNGREYISLNDVNLRYNDKVDLRFDRYDRIVEIFTADYIDRNREIVTITSHTFDNSLSINKSSYGSFVLEKNDSVDYYINGRKADFNDAFTTISRNNYAINGEVSFVYGKVKSIYIDTNDYNVTKLGEILAIAKGYYSNDYTSTLLIKVNGENKAFEMSNYEVEYNNLKEGKTVRVELDYRGNITKIYKY